MKSKSNETVDVCIVGGGIVGLTLAALLAESGLAITVIEPSPVPAKFKPESFGLRVSAINLASMRIFSHLGIAKQILDTRACGYRSMQIWDANSDAKIHFNADDAGHDNLGYIIENDIIINILLNYIKDHSNIILRHDRLQSINQYGNGINITLTEETQQTKLLIGADGQHSKVRSLVGFEMETGVFNQTAMVCRVRTESEHQQTAYQCFHHSGPIAYLPLADGSSSIVWSCDSHDASRLQQMDDPAFAVAVEEMLQSKLGHVKIIGPRAAFELTQQHARRYIDTRIALVGDAAHRTHPLAGLGANLGLQDAAVLAETIQSALAQQRPFHASGSLRKYERIRRHQNALILDTMQAFKTGFASQSPLLTSLRAAALNQADSWRPIKTLISQFATGDMGDLPKICRPGHLHHIGSI
jgi:2-octaprenylphenol hydroxylase